MSVGTVFVHNGAQAVSLPSDVCLPEGVREVEVRACGNELIITPLRKSWDSFFMTGAAVSDDFLPLRAKQHP